MSEMTDMRWMFNNATAFNQDLSSWNVRNVTHVSGMFNNATAFIKGENFNKTIESWASQKGVSVESLIKDVLH